MSAGISSSKKMDARVKPRVKPAHDRAVLGLKSTLIAFGALLSAVALSAPAAAQPGSPNRSVQLIVPYGAGGVADSGMRILTEQLTGLLKQPFGVENRPGAGGLVAGRGGAAEAGASAAPDGYTLLMTGNNNAISAGLFKALPYDILTDFASTSTVSFFDLLIVTRADSPLASVQDIVKAARAD